MRILVYGDSNSWGCPPDGSGIRIAARWPVVMADILGAELIEDALPGRTTRHDDDEMHGPTQNGLSHLPASLLAAQPVDWVLIMLGTNDLKARFRPGAGRIATHLMELVACVGETGGGPGCWGESPAPRVGLIVPPPLPAMADDPGWERAPEWQGGRAASQNLAAAVLKAATPDVSVLDAGRHIGADAADPIHFGVEAHQVLGRVVAAWLQDQM